MVPQRVNELKLVSKMLFRISGARVEHNGAGVGDAQHETTFAKYAHRIDRPGSHGLRFTINKEAIEAHGSDIGVRPAVGGGSVFWFMLPSSPKRADSFAVSLGTQGSATQQVAR